MFNGKKIKSIEERLKNLEQFEKSVYTICDNYFAKNEKKDLSFSTGCTADKFYYFVMSVDKKLKMLGKIEEENKTLKAEHEEQKQFCETAKKTIDEKNAVIKAQEKEIKELVRLSTKKRGQKNGVQK